MTELTVELYGTVVGRLSGDRRTFDFVVDQEAIDRFGLDSDVLSLAIPLTVVPVRARKERRQNFFRELLPEGNMRTRLAQEARVPEYDVLGLLRAYGRDIAGALQIWDANDPGEPREPSVEPLDPSGVADLLRHVQENPLGNKAVGGKTSLAGVQDKIVLASINGDWHRVVDGWPSTHILKPEARDQPTSIYDEEYGARFVRAAGLSSFGTRICEFDGTAAVVIERYDRDPTAPEGRVHQEDLSQVLGAAGNEKYQRFGGRVSLERVARMLPAGDIDSRERLFRLVVVSVAVGNLDLHTKNISLLHPLDGSIELAPAYDVVPQAHQPNDGETALAIGGEYRHAALTVAHLEAEGATWGLARARSLAEETLEIVLETSRSEVADERAFPGLARQIEQFTRNLLQGRPVDEPAIP